ncbi:hypothetical protein ACFC6L_26930 [Kitasatospora phosalacinea]|uniref:hypothetical protein n=1 Tax=Kitasatospora phosalacinea TaxID=2065 RepID=UPI0035DD0179
MTLWHQSGRTVPGRRDHEWSRLVTPPRFSAHPAPVRERCSPPGPGPDGAATEAAAPEAPTPEPPAFEPPAPEPLAFEPPGAPPAAPSPTPVPVPSVVRPREAS